MTLHPQSQAFLNQLAEQPTPSWEELGITESRRVFEQFAQFAGHAPELTRVESLQVDDAPPMRLYADSNADDLPVIVYFHGGGWVLGSLDSHDALCRRIAVDSGCAVVAVDYGRSPENAFPGPIEDAIAATLAVSRNASAWRLNADRIAVAGDSAGGHLAASVAIAARDRSDLSLAAQLLIYPVIAPRFDTDSYINYAEGFGLTRDVMRWFWRQFLGEKQPDATCVPAIVSDLTGLPDTLLLTAEYDVLHDEGSSYADSLKCAGVDVESFSGDGMLHGFIHLAGIFESGLTLGREVAARLGARLRSVVSR
ncbi:MAG: alpha/beta hydrolase [Planctomycetota bacterium]